MSKLTAKQATFVAEYLIDLNATQAAIRAGYSAKDADVTGPRLLGNVGIASAINEAMQKRSIDLEINGERVLAETAKLAFSDIRDIFDAEGRLLPPKQWPDHAAAAVASMKVRTVRVPGGKPTDVEHVVEIKTWDKPKTLELLGKHLKLFSDTLNVPGLEGIGAWLDKKIAENG